MTAPRRARVRALAKLNLDLRVLGRRPDGYHELRTIFQTISLADTLDIAFTPGRKTAIALDDPLEIPGNLVVKAAEAVVDAVRVRGHVAVRLQKRIPMGGGLGGGSSDAAAVLLALPVLAGRRIELPRLLEIAMQLGSDVPFFLLGGTAVGIGRGTELFPVTDAKPVHGILVTPSIHVSTAQAYQRLSARLTTESQQNKIFSFQSLAWGGSVPLAVCNDFEAVVFTEQKRLGGLKRRLLRAGASLALMSGSGSAVFGLFQTAMQARSAQYAFRGEEALRISLVSRARYRAMWWRALEAHIEQKIWPPQSRYAQ